MRHSHMRLLLRTLLLSCLLLGWSSQQKAQAQLSQGLVPDSTELRVLRQFYYATGGRYWTVPNADAAWPATADAWTAVAQTATPIVLAGSWVGVGVRNGDILSLDLTATNLWGTLPASLGDLSELVNLTLSNNPGLTGAIPASLGHPNLGQLDLSKCHFTGSIPADLGQASRLQNLQLQYNTLSGELPASLGQLPVLYALDLSHNQLSGFFPYSWSTLPELKILNLSYNQLTGPLPDIFQGLSGLTYCFLEHNQFSGALPESLGDCSHLYQLRLQYNQFSGALPGSLTKLPGLYILEAQHNQLTGIPSWTDMPFNAPHGLDVSDNYLDFDDLEPLFWSDGSTPIYSLTFAPQRVPSAYTIRCRVGDSQKLHRNMGGTHSHYQWERQIGQVWVPMPGQTDTMLVLEKVSRDMAGFYRLQVWNDQVATLHLEHLPLYSQAYYIDLLPYYPITENTPVESSLVQPPTSLLAPPSVIGNDSVPPNYVRTYTARQAFTVHRRPWTAASNGLMAGVAPAPGHCASHSLRCVRAAAQKLSALYSGTDP
jgi:Leucine-rich repeat (LRR) protein